MLTDTVTVGLVVAVLALFAWLGLRVGADRNVEGFALAGRGESGRAIGLSFLASGLGAWVLAAPPEIGASTGVVGVAGYAVGVAAPLIALAVLGTRLRQLLPDGRSLADYARRRYGRSMQVTVSVITLVYMGVAAAAELTAAGGILARLTGVDTRWILSAVVLVTLAYTAYGGLRASLRTDAWQAWLLVALVVGTGGALLARVPEPASGIADGLQRGTRLIDVEVAAALAVAILVTTLFHNGMWQRVWAARDEAALRRGALIGVATRVPLVVAAGTVGILAIGIDTELDDPPMPLLALLDGLPTWTAGLMLVLLVALAASSIDTLENGMGSLLATEVPSIGLRGARVATGLTVVPALVAAFQGWSVVQLLMVANLLCATAVAPAALGLWRRATTGGAVAGCWAGLLAIALYGWSTGDGLVGAIDVVTFADGPRLTPFVIVVGGAGLATVAVSLARKEKSATDVCGDRSAR